MLNVQGGWGAAADFLGARLKGQFCVLAVMEDKMMTARKRVKNSRDKPI